MRLGKILALVLPLLATGLVSLEVAQATETNLWRHPGQHPLSSTPLGRDAAALNCAARLPAPAGAFKRLKEKLDAGFVGETRQLKDGMRFTAQSYEGCHIWRNVQVAFGAADYDRDAEFITVTADDGTKVIYVRPHICDNWSIFEIITPPNPRCFRVYFDHSKNDDVDFRTVDEMKATGAWHLSEAQAYLSGDSIASSILMHVDVSDDERASAAWRECFGVGDDESGFHAETEECLTYCADGGVYPNEHFLRLLAEQKGIRLGPKPPWSAQVVCPGHGRCYVQLPLFAATRQAIFCVGVHRYKLSVAGFKRGSSRFYFDLMNPIDDPNQGQRSLLLQKKIRGDAELLDASGHRRYMDGELRF